MSQIIPLALMVGAVSAAPSGGNQQNSATQEYLTRLNKNLSENYAWSLLAFAVVIFLYRSLVRLYAHMRHLSSLSATSQKYFAEGDPRVNWVKNHIFYAPIFRHKRATEIQFHRLINFGSLPTRFQFIFIWAIIIVNVFACCWEVPWNDARLQVLPILRNRTGTLSVANLVPILVMATVKNPLIELLDISYDTFNLMHRWLGRLSILQGVAHTVCWMVAKVEKEGWEGVNKSVQFQFIYAGLAATVGFVVLFFQAPKMVRSWAYEVFLHMHIVVVIVTFAFLWIHLLEYPQLGFLIASIAIWAATRAWRFASLAYRTWGGSGRCQAVVEALPGDALRVTLTTPRPWKYKSGQSLYLTIPSVGLWTAHPFSIAWSDAEHGLKRSATVLKRGGTVKAFDDIEKRPIVRSRPQSSEMEKATYSLVIKARTGMTGKLYDRVARGSSPDEAGKMTFNACIEGPYGGDRSMASYGTVMLFASGVGITHQIPYIKQLLEGYNDGTVAARRITLVWAVTSTDCLEWIRPWMHDILGIENRRDVLKIILYITRAGLSQPIRSPSETVRMIRGRPDVLSLMEAEAAERVGCMGVSVCSGGGLDDEVRRATRILLSKGTNIEMESEGFGW